MIFVTKTHRCDSTPATGPCNNVATTDLGAHRRIVGMSGEVRHLCAGCASGRVSTPRANRSDCNRCGAELVEGRYCENCD